MSRIYYSSLALFFSLCAAMPAAADDNTGVYINLGVTQLSAELDLTDTQIQGQTVNLGEESSNIIMATGRLGYRLHENFAIEGEAGFGLGGGDDFSRVIPVGVGGTIANVDTNIGLNVDNYYVAFGRAILPVSDQVDIFIRGGYGTAEPEAEVIASFGGVVAEGSVSDNASGFAYGIGGQFNFTPKDGIRADYTRLEDAGIVSIAYARRF